MWLIFQDRFTISDIVPSLKMPKLIVVTRAMQAYTPGAEKLYDEALASKQKVAINNEPNQPVYLQSAWHNAVSNFLNTLASSPDSQSHP